VFIGFAAGWIVEYTVIQETPDSNRFGLVSDICVLAAYRGRPIATRLLDALSERLCRAGVRRIRLSVLAANRIARAAYEHAGFTPYEVVYQKTVGADGAQNRSVQRKRSRARGSARSNTIGRYRRTALCDLLQLGDEEVNKDRLYRRLGRLLAHTAALEAHLWARCGELFAVENDVLLYDVTSAYFEGQAEANPQAQRGYSRGHRPDCKQVLVALVVTFDGFPLGYEVFAGNTHDGPLSNRRERAGSTVAALRDQPCEGGVSARKRSLAEGMGHVAARQEIRLSLLPIKSPAINVNDRVVDSIPLSIIFYCGSTIGNVSIVNNAISAA
jgi:hypothetical protein